MLPGVAHVCSWQRSSNRQAFNPNLPHAKHLCQYSLPLLSPEVAKYAAINTMHRESYLIILQVAEELGDLVRIVKIDTDEHPEVSSQLQVLPTKQRLQGSSGCDGVGKKPRSI